jgi:hypothetical protein
MAQVVVKVLFERYFKSKYGENAKVLMEADYRSIRFGGVVDKLLDAMTDDFANAWTASSLRGKVDLLKVGRPRRPDVMGIAPPDVIYGFTIELVEVTSEKQAAKTIKEDIIPKLQILNDKVVPIFLAKLREELQSSIFGARVLASPWRPNQDELVWPFGSANSTRRNVEWLCLRPTFRGGADGLILYEYHSVPLPDGVPQEVIERLRNKVRRQTGPVLAPFLKMHWDENPADAAAMKALCLVLGGGALIGIAILLLPEEAAAGAVVGAGAGLARVAAAATAAAAAFPRSLDVARGVLESLGAAAR